jgi:nucleotide-binding universal stress UspA family protein
MFRTILIAVDSSEASDRAVMVGGEIANRFDSRVIVVYANPQARAAREGKLPGYDALLAEYGRQADRILAKVRHRLWRQGVGGVELIFELDRPVSGILRVANQYAVELVVMGSRGLGDVGSMVMGSVSTRVAHRAGCPVLIVR